MFVIIQIKIKAVGTKKKKGNFDSPKLMWLKWTKTKNVFLNSFKSDDGMKNKIDWYFPFLDWNGKNGKK